MKNTILTYSFILLLTNSVFCAEFETERLQNWPQWRGPDANGVSSLAKPPAVWSESENIKWKIKVPGNGSSSPIIWNDQIIVLSAVKTERKAENASPAPSIARPSGRRRGRRRSPPQNYYQFVVMSLDRTTGDLQWKKVATEEVPHEGHHQTASFASCSPITDGKHIYAMFGSRGIYCYDMEGDFKWKRDLGDMKTRNSFGEGGSPALSGETLVIPWDNEEQSFVYALDTKTGKTKWKNERDEVTTWATPLIVESEGKNQVVVHGVNRVRSYELDSGKLIWECGGQSFNPVASPVTDNGLVYCTTGRRGYAMYAIPLSAKGDISDSDQISWSRTDSGSYVPSPLIYKGQLYYNKECNAVLYSLDASNGETIYGPTRLTGLRTLYSSPVAADGRIYITSREGITLVLKHGPELKILATNKLDEGVDASPALVGKEIFLRGQQHLYCISDE